MRTSKRRLCSLLALASLLGLSACGGASHEGVPEDAGPATGTDAGSTTEVDAGADAGTDAGLDASLPAPDGGAPPPTNGCREGAGGMLVREASGGTRLPYLSVFARAVPDFDCPFEVTVVGAADEIPYGEDLGRIPQVTVRFRIDSMPVVPANVEAELVVRLADGAPLVGSATVYLTQARFPVEFCTVRSCDDPGIIEGTFRGLAEGAEVEGSFETGFCDVNTWCEL